LQNKNINKYIIKIKKIIITSIIFKKMQGPLQPPRQEDNHKKAKNAQTTNRTGTQENPTNTSKKTLRFI
jgi:hypothetical protein